MSNASDLADFGREVWDTLSQIDVSPFIEKKGRLDFVSWANAWTLTKGAFPLSKWMPVTENFLDNGTCEVVVAVEITNGTHSVAQSCSLPVMDHHNKAIQGPDTRDINDARMRCLVKCLAMLGLGIEVYGADALPEEPTVKAAGMTDEQREAIDGLKAYMTPNQETWWEKGPDISEQKAAEVLKSLQGKSLELADRQAGPDEGDHQTPVGT